MIGGFGRYDAQKSLRERNSGEVEKMNAATNTMNEWMRE